MVGYKEYRPQDLKKIFILKKIVMKYFNNINE